MIEKRYNFHFKKIITLHDGEMFCHKCDGKGRVSLPIHRSNPRFVQATLQCDKCLGDGKIDWIENVVGKKINGGESS